MDRLLTAWGMVILSALTLCLVAITVAAILGALGGGC